MKLKLKLAFLAMCVCVLICVCASKKKEAITDSLQLMNIEALASGETGGVKCTGVGSVECPINDWKVYYIW
ncbi:NVEALA domain-containing protein [Bacteroides sp.]